MHALTNAKGFNTEYWDMSRLHYKSIINQPSWQLSYLLTAIYTGTQTVRFLTATTTLKIDIIEKKHIDQRNVMVSMTKLNLTKA